MTSFICTGRLELNGVTFFIEAETEEEAKQKAEAGDWEDWDCAGAESINWKLRPQTVEKN